MQIKHIHAKWRVFRRIGIAMVLLAITSIVVYNYLPPNTYNSVLQASQPDNVLLVQRNQFLTIETSCTSCNQQITLNFTIDRIISNDFNESKLIKFYSYNLIHSLSKNFTLLLDPSTYVIYITVQGNYTANLHISTMGVPYKFIETQGIIMIGGIILITIDIDKKNMSISNIKKSIRKSLNFNKKDLNNKES